MCKKLIFLVSFTLVLGFSAVNAIADLVSLRLRARLGRSGRLAIISQMLVYSVK